MKIEKYNQRLLATLGTVGVIFLIVALITFISIAIIEHRRYDDDTETGILSDEKIEKLQKENKREQVISYDTPKLVDTLNFGYIIPVSHKTLNEKEDINSILGYTSSKEYAPSDRRYSGGFYGEFNNIIIYNPIDGTNKKLFDERVNFDDINTEYFDKEILLLMQIAKKDTHKDGVINLKDFKSLYIYSFMQKELKKIEINGMDVFDYKFIHNSKDLIIEFGVDKNDDGQYEEHNEPTLIKKYNFESGLLTDIIDKQINIDLQKTLEGSIK